MMAMFDHGIASTYAYQLEFECLALSEFVRGGARRYYFVCFHRFFSSKQSLVCLWLVVFHRRKITWLSLSVLFLIDWQSHLQNILFRNKTVH